MKSDMKPLKRFAIRLNMHPPQAFRSSNGRRA
jgi:hypothetical protein